jgi:hypothetical protein
MSGQNWKLRGGLCVMNCEFENAILRKNLPISVTNNTAVGKVRLEYANRIADPPE